uniref:G-protein coupled receptors family 1 profile domain-containing protein n=1 Tax=Parascaris univalens TaxID=6257 RepID=A0A915BNM4_PARUN
MSNTSYETQIEVPSTNEIALADDLDAKLERQWYYLLLSVVPIACILGNCMVVAAVWTTKSLQTTTNYLIASLAVADLVVGTFVMPFSIYLSVNALHWHLPLSVCYFYCVLDVAASTCSIVHLVLISVDRWVLRNFCCSQTSQACGGYKTRRIQDCEAPETGLRCHWACMGFQHRTVTASCSIFAFYLPCIVMILTYGYIFYTLRRRLQAIQLQEMAGGQFVGFGADVGNIANSAMQTVIGVAPSNRQAISWEKPLLKKIEETAAEHASSLNESEREQLQNILDAVQPCSSSSQETTLFDEDLKRRSSLLLGDVAPRSSITQNNAFGDGLQIPHPLHVKSMRRRFSEALQTFSERSHQAFHAESELGTDFVNRRYSYQPESNATCRPSGDHSGNLTVPHDWALDLLAKLRSKQGMAIRRETRATKLVAIVMGKF